MRGALAAAALLLVILCALPTAGSDEVPATEDKARSPEALILALLRAKPDDARPLERALRARGPKLAPLLRAARAKASAGGRARIDRLYRRIELDHHRAHVPKGMVYIPAGLFERPLAKAPYGPSGERGQVKAFYIDRTEVTVGAWRTWVDGLEARAPGTIKRLRIHRPKASVAADLPIANVRWREARRYATEARGGRLPEADEFDRALRGSSIATYPWGETMRNAHANVRDVGPGWPVPVGSYPKGAGPFGALDLVGNVAEWSATHVAQGRSGRYPLVLGGSFRDSSHAELLWRAKPRMRARMGPEERSATVGFRVVSDVPKLP